MRCISHFELLNFDHTFCLLVALVGAVCLLQIAEVLPAEAVLVLQACLKYSTLTSRVKCFRCLDLLKYFEISSQMFVYDAA